MSRGPRAPVAAVNPHHLFSDDIDDPDPEQAMWPNSKAEENVQQRISNLIFSSD